MAENEISEFQIIMSMLIKRNEKNYLLIIASNKSRDFAIILIQQSSFVYCNKYLLDDFKKINFFKNYFGLSQCIEILINLFREKKDLIKIEEEENQIVKLGLEIELSIVGMTLNLPSEKVEFILNNDNVDQIIQNNLLWYSVLYLFNEKEENKKLIQWQDGVLPGDGQRRRNADAPAVSCV